MFRKSILFVLVLVAPTGSAQDDAFWPGVTYDTGVPTMEEVLGHAPGERIVSHAEMVRYLEALAESRPRQIHLHEYAQSWEGRAVVYAVVGSEEHMVRVADVQRDMKRLSDPRTTTDADARTIIDDQPAITWLAYGVHGNEISSPDASLYTGLPPPRRTKRRHRRRRP